MRNSNLKLLHLVASNCLPVKNSQPRINPLRVETAETKRDISRMEKIIYVCDNYNLKPLFALIDKANLISYENWEMETSARFDKAKALFEQAENELNEAFSKMLDSDLEKLYSEIQEQEVF